MDYTFYRADPRQKMNKYIQYVNNFIYGNFWNLISWTGVSEKFKKLKQLEENIKRYVDAYDGSDLNYYVTKHKLIYDGLCGLSDNYKYYCMEYIKLCKNFIFENYDKLSNMDKYGYMGCILEIEKDINQLFNTAIKLNIKSMLKNNHIIFCSGCKKISEKVTIDVKCCKEKKICRTCLLDLDCQCDKCDKHQLVVSKPSTCHSCDVMLCLQFGHKNLCYSCEIMKSGYWNPDNFSNCRQKVKSNIFLFLLILKHNSKIIQVPPKFIRYKIFYYLI